MCLETRTHGSEGGKSREGPTYLVGDAREKKIPARG